MFNMEVDEASDDKLDLLHPELFSREGLIELFRERHISTDELAEKSKQDLINIYYEKIIPLPQRKYRQNRRGREMTKKQILMAKRKRRYDDISSNQQETQKKNASPNSSRLLTSFSVPPSGDRLKPPPSAINPDRKVIKLGGSKAKTDSTSSKPSVKSTPVKVISLNRTKKSVIINSTGDTKNSAGSTSGKVNSANGQEKKDTSAPKKSSMAEVIASEAADSADVKIKQVTDSVKVITVTPHKTAKPTSKIRLKRPSAGALVTSPVSTSPTESLPSVTSENSSEISTKSPEPMEEEHFSKSADTEEQEDGVIKKKFKRTAVTWP